MWYVSRYDESRGLYEVRSTKEGVVGYYTEEALYDLSQTEDIKGVNLNYIELYTKRLVAIEVCKSKMLGLLPTSFDYELDYIDGMWSFGVSNVHCSSDVIRLPNGIDAIYSKNIKWLRNNTTVKRIIVPKSLRNFNVKLDCNSLEEFDFTNLEFVCNEAFAHSGFKSLDLVSTRLSSLSHYCFSDCESLKSVTLGESIKVVESGCFINCTVLGEVRMLGVEKLKPMVFAGCIRLRKVQLPSSLTAIGVSCFFQCISLKKIRIPSSVINFGQNCFSGCTNLKEIYYNNLQIIQSGQLQDTGALSCCKIYTDDNRVFNLDGTEV